MDEVQALLIAGAIFTAGFAGYVILDDGDAEPEWPIVDVCIGGHSDSLAEHYHPILNIIIDGNIVEIPANVGIEDSYCPNGMRGIHTHDSTGKLHVEIPDSDYNATVGAFFEIWGMEFDENHILNKVANEENEVVMFVNGIQNDDYENYVMEDGDQIEIRYQAK